MDGLRGLQERQVYNIRKATPEDFSAVLPMAEKFYKSTDYYNEGMDFDIPSILEYYILMLTSGFVMVADEDGKLVGMMGCLVTPFQLNLNHVMCTEAMWWVDPDYRGLSIAKDLKLSAEAEAKELGCTKMVMSSLRTSPSIVDQWYENSGYVLTEKAFMRGL